jgi:hypothetical protein
VFYELVLAAPSKVRISADAAVPVTVSLATSCGAAAASCASDATVSALEFEALPAGRYVVQVEGADGAGAFGLSTVVTPAAGPTTGETCAAPTATSASKPPTRRRAGPAGAGRTSAPWPRGSTARRTTGGTRRTSQCT